MGEAKTEMERLARRVAALERRDINKKNERISSGIESVYAAISKAHAEMATLHIEQWEAIGDIEQWCSPRKDGVLWRDELLSLTARALTAAYCLRFAANRQRDYIKETN